MHSTRTVEAGHGAFIEFYPDPPNGGVLIANAHWHLVDPANPHKGSSFSDRDRIKGGIARSDTQ
jgi:hypothetical protein